MGGECFIHTTTSYYMLVQTQDKLVDGLFVTTLLLALNVQILSITNNWLHHDFFASYHQRDISENRNRKFHNSKLSL